MGPGRGDSPGVAETLWFAYDGMIRRRPEGAEHGGEMGTKGKRRDSVGAAGFAEGFEGGASDAHVDARDSGGQTAAMRAACCGRADLLSLLIGDGADVEARDGLGWSALMQAASLGREACVALLAASGANLDSKHHGGWTAAMQAAAYGHGGCLGLLIDAGADLEAKENKGRTASMLATAKGHHGLAELIDGIVRARSETAELGLAAPSPSPGQSARGSRL